MDLKKTLRESDKFLLCSILNNERIKVNLDKILQKMFQNLFNNCNCFSKKSNRQITNKLYHW